MNGPIYKQFGEQIGNDLNDLHSKALYRGKTPFIFLTRTENRFSESRPEIAKKIISEERV